MTESDVVSWSEEEKKKLEPEEDVEVKEEMEERRKEEGKEGKDRYQEQRDNM